MTSKVICSDIFTGVIEVIKHHMPIYHSPCRRRYIGPLPSCFPLLLDVLFTKQHYPTQNRIQNNNLTQLPDTQKKQRPCVKCELARMRRLHEIYKFLVLFGLTQTPYLTAPDESSTTAMRSYSTTCLFLIALVDAGIIGPLPSCFTLTCLLVL